MFCSCNHGQTIKTLGVTSGGGAFVPMASFLLEPGLDDEGFSQVGPCADPALVEACGLDKLLEEGFQSLANKGFLMHSHWKAVGHELITPLENMQRAFGLREAENKQ